MARAMEMVKRWKTPAPFLVINKKAIIDMKGKLVIILSICLICRLAASAQQQEIYNALIAAGQINPRFPVADSLHPVNITSWKELAKTFQLAGKQLSRVKKCSRKQQGAHLDRPLTNQMNLLDAQPYYQGLRTGDSTFLAFVNAHKPFYVLSSPLLFNDNQDAIVEVDLVGSGGYTFLLHRQGQQWAIVKTMVRWVV